MKLNTLEQIYLALKEERYLVTISDSVEKACPTLERVFEDDSFYFKTKGDANEAPDPWIVKPEDVSGTLILTIPYYGYLIHFAGTPIGFVLMVVTLAVLFIANEVRKTLQLKRGWKS